MNGAPQQPPKLQPQLRECACRDCWQVVEEPKRFCDSCWALVPVAIRRRLLELWSYREGEAFLQVLIEAEQSVRAARRDV